MTSLKQKTYHSFAWDFAGKISNQIVGFGISIILARLLMPEDFGLLAMVNVFIGVSAIFMDMGLSSSLVQQKRLRPIHYNSVFYFNLAVAAFLTLLLFFSAPLIAAYYKRQELLLLTQVLSFSFIINSLTTVQYAYLKKRMEFSKFTKYSISSGVISGLLGVILAYHGFGVWALVWQSLLGSVIYAILIWVFSHWKPELSFSFKALKQLWGYGFRMFLSGILESIYTRVDVLIIGRLFPADILGYFQRAKSLDQLVVTYSSSSLMQVLFPVLSSIQHDLTRFKEVVTKAYNYLNIVVFFILGWLYLGAEDLISILFSDKWLPAVPYFKILVLSSFVYPLSALLVNVLSSRGNSKAFLKLEIIKKIVFTGCFPVFFYYGIMGYLWAFVFAAFFALLANIYFVKREINISFFKYLKTLGLYIFISSILVIIIRLLLPLEGHKLHFIIASTLYTSAYVGIVFGFKLEGSMFLLDEVKKISVIQKTVNYFSKG